MPLQNAVGLGMKLVLEPGMQMLKHRSVRSLLSVAALTAVAGLATTTAHADQPASKPILASNSVIEQASAFYAAGKLVEARDVLMPLIQKDGGRSLADADRARAFELLSTLNREIQTLSPSALTLQKAQAAVRSDDLAAAERHAKVVASLPDADALTVQSALDVMAEVQLRRKLVADRLPSAIAGAQDAVQAQEFARAKSLLDSVIRSGIVLDPQDQAAVDLVLASIIEHEDASGQFIEAPRVSLALLQPGVVKRRDDIPPPVNGNAKNGNGAPAPQTAPVSAPAPALASASADGNQPGTQPPAATPPAATTPAATPPANEQDLIKQARQFEAQAMLAEADLAFTERRLNEAANKYARLQSEYRDLLNTEQGTHVDARLTESRLLLRGNIGPDQDIISSAIQQNQFARQATLAEFNNLLDQSRRQLASENVLDARTQALKARLTLNAAREYFSEGEYENLYKQTADLITEIDTKEEAIRRAGIEQQERDLKAAAESTRAQREQSRVNEINEQIDRVRALQMEMKYREALQVVDQILFRDPINPTGLLLKDVLTGMMIYSEYNQLRSEFNIKSAILDVQMREAIIPGADIINYPSDWPAISFRRGETAAFREPPENQAVLAMLDKPLQTARFNSDPLGNIVEFVEAVSELNIDVDWQSLEEIGIDRTTPISLNLSRVPLRVVLDRILDKASPDRLSRASWAVNDGVLQIASDEALRRNTVLAIYDVRDLLIEVPDYDEAPEFDLSQVLQQAGSGGGGGGQSPFQDDQDDQRERLPLDERRKEIVDIIIQNVDFDGWIDNGGDTGNIQPLGGSLIITNTARNHREIGGLLSKLREQRALQINVETRFLLVSSGFFEQIGFDLDVYFNSNNNQVRAAQATDPTIQGGDFFNFAGGGLNRNVTGATGVTQGVVNPRSWSPIGAGQNSLGLASSLLSGALPDGSVGSTVSGLAPALGVAGQFLDDIQVDFLVRATQADRRSVQLTAPRVTFTNGQTSNIVVATQVAFISDLNPITSDSAVGFDPVPATVTEGVRLLVDGTVSADRRYVTLNVDARIAQIEGFAERPVTAVAGGQLVSSADTASFVQLPTISTTQVQTTVTVPDQGTILLGGQRLLTEVEVETGVPVLSKIPIISRFFTNRIESTEEQTLLILLKPTILIQNEEEERNFPGLGDAARAGFGG